MEIELNKFYLILYRMHLNLLWYIYICVGRVSSCSAAVLLSSPVLESG